MGNSGSLVVGVDNSYYRPGDKVTGTVTAVLHEAVSCSGLYLNLKGKEKTQIVEGRTTGNTDTTTYYKSSVSLVDECFALFKCPNGDGLVQPGTYSYPFSFDLPNGLPSSFYRRGAAVEGFIKYKLKAEFDVNGNFSKNWYQTREVFVFENLELYEEHQVVESESKPIRMLGCIGNGIARIDANIATNCFLAGDRIHVHANVVSKKNIKSIRAELVRNINIKAERRDVSDTKVIAVAEGPSKKGEIVLELAIPEDIKYPTTEGEYITVWYEVVVRGVISWSRDPRVELPIVICFDK